MDTLDADLNARLGALKAAGRYRTLDELATPQGPLIAIDGKPYLNFCSNDYLGLANHPDIRAAMRAAVDSCGVGSGAAALLSGRHRAHLELEEALCTYLGRDRALLFSSGYLANVGAVAALVSRDDFVLHDRLNHASLIDGVRLTRASEQRYPHVDVQAVEDALEASTAKRKWVLTDCLFSMDGDVAPLVALAASCRRQGAVLLGDDAHGFGVLGDGRGTPAACGLAPSDLPVLVVTFGKALGTSGAAVLGSEALVDWLIQRARTFIFDTAPPPALAAATTCSLSILQTESWRRTKLQDNIAYFRHAAAAERLALMDSHTPIQPLLIGDDQKAVAASASLARLGIYVRAVRPPTVPPGTARLRIGLTAAHEKTHLDRLVEALAHAL